jgi:hypothetical protein
MKAKFTDEQYAPLSSIPQNEYIKRHHDSQKVYIRGHYDRESKRYSLMDCEDMNREIFLKGSTMVFVGFTY